MTKRLVALCGLVTMLVGCPGSTGDMKAVDPTERGLSYLAAAIVTAAVIRALFND